MKKNIKKEKGKGEEHANASQYYYRDYDKLKYIVRIMLRACIIKLGIYTWHLEVHEKLNSDSNDKRHEDLWKSNAKDELL